MERRTKDLPTPLLVLIAPTRVLFETKYVGRKRRMGINRWSWIWLAINMAFLFLLPELQRHLKFWHGLFLLIWLVPFSRIIEITYAFYNDSFDQLEGIKPRSGLRRVQRFKLLGRSYFEIAVSYATIYLALPRGSFANPPATSFDSLYFSWITITTTGFGDITPSSAAARLLCMTELGLGLMLIVLTVGTYFSSKDSSLPTED